MLLWFRAKREAPFAMLRLFYRTAPLSLIHRYASSTAHLDRRQQRAVVAYIDRASAQQAQRKLSDEVR